MRLTVTLALILGLSPLALGQGLSGDWIGGFKQNDRWTLLRAQFQQSGGGLNGVLDTVIPAYRQSVQPQTRLTDVRVSEASIGFHYVTSQRDMVFSGKVDGNSISGTVQGKTGSSGPFQLFRIRLLDGNSLQEYFGTYQFGPNEFLYIQTWDETSGLPLLYAFRESGEVRALYPVDRDDFFAGPGAAFPIGVESSIRFQRNARNEIVGLTWQNENGQLLRARRIAVEKSEHVRFTNKDIQLTGRLLLPTSRSRHPAVILVHGSGPESRDAILPFARFLVRHGVAVLGYDKRGVGESTGDWNTSSLDDLADDVLAAFRYLETRSDIDKKQIGLLGISQASAVMPLAVVREPKVAFLISLSSGGVPFAETDLDYTRNEMKMTGAPETAINQQVAATTLLYDFLRTGEGWEKYAGTLPPGTVRKDDPRWEGLRKMALYDPTPTLEKLRLPVLAIWGSLDNITMPDKQKPLWEKDLRKSGNRDYSLVVVPKGDHDMLEAEVGSSAEMPRLQRFVPEYSATVLNWLKMRLRGFQYR
jgi:pimeloyl-ACP methyl ester carboxylesterase